MIISRMGAYELIFKVVDTEEGAYGKICAFSLCVSALEFDSVNRADKADAYGKPLHYKYKI